MRQQIEVYLENQKSGVLALKNILSIFCDKGDGLEKHLDEYLKKYGSVVGDVAAKRVRLSHGILSDLDLTFMLTDYCELHKMGDIANDPTFINGVMLKLKSCLAVSDAGSPLPEQYQLNSNRFSMLRDLGLLDNIIFGSNYILRRYSKSIPVVVVRDGSKQESCGTGIFIRLSIETGLACYILTNRHVVDGKNVELISANSITYEVLSPPILCDYADLAIIKVQDVAESDSFIFNAVPRTLDNVIACGYPAIPHTKNQDLMAHKGEINGTVTGYDDNQYLAISCHVSPGNSGGPLIDEWGQCIGVVSQSNIGQYGNSNEDCTQVNSIYHMAIPPVVALKFIAENTDGQARFTHTHYS